GPPGIVFRPLLYARRNPELHRSRHRRRTPVRRPEVFPSRPNCRYRPRPPQRLHPRPLPLGLLSVRFEYSGFFFFVTKDLQAISSSSPLAMPSEAAYSMCRTRLGALDCDFDDACTIRGRIARTPLHGTRPSTGATRVERLWSSSSLRT